MNAALINPFTDSGSASVPFAKSEATSLIAPHEVVTLSDGVGAKPVLAFTPSEAATDPGRAVAATLSHNKITQAVEIQSSCGGGESRPAKRDQPDLGNPTGDGGSRPKPIRANCPAGVASGPQDQIDLEQLIGVAGKRRRRPLALPRFAPDFPEIWKAMHDKSAPRTVLDPLWADASPLFLQKIG